ncbi:hypothetical protein DO97_04625 [Neosynechococcus sphagnicola sy1]|uniref:Secondary thiamine-phosphate synthase enzyme n=1 Tax=Neosynechococcus sphagnicola sy1 TaxID=1497020 RepID=A0A098TKH6_9CYAN|nr:secondary thiamine-phosphate synthase enzyme YjbQ [Neosynechococcus sphagnicola]KGF72781.1 hypothetical protein DO97_04625 [Neosynechococcus sphagnicola sy1]
MTILYRIFEITTNAPMGIFDLTPQIRDWIATTAIRQGQALICSRHTTTALVINESEVRLCSDIQTFLQKLVPAAAPYLHNDLHLRTVLEDEPMNAHAHLMAMLLSTSEVVPIVDGKLALGTWQSVLLVELDGPRQRTVSVQLMGEPD